MYHLAVFKFLLPVCHLILKMIQNYIEILQVHQRFLAFVACVVDTMHLLGIIFILFLLKLSASNRCFCLLYDRHVGAPRKGTNMASPCKVL